MNSDTPRVRHPGCADLERLCRRSDWLDRRDKALVQMIFDKGGTFDQVARLTGQNPSTVSRRCRQVLRKLIAKELTALLRRRPDLTGTVIRIVQEHYLYGRSQRSIAHRLNVSHYRVRKVLDAVRTVAYAAGAPCPTPQKQSQPYPKGTVPCTH